MLAAVRGNTSLALRPVHPALSRSVHAVSTKQLLRVPAVARTVAALRAAAISWPRSTILTARPATATTA